MNGLNNGKYRRLTSSNASGGRTPNALRFTNSYPFAPPPNNPNEEMQKHATSRRKRGKDKREKTESAPKKQNGEKKRSRNTEKRAGRETPLVSPHPNRTNKRKKPKGRARSLFCRVLCT